MLTVSMFLFTSLVGSFGIAFLGFAFAIDDTPKHTAALYRPDWVNATLNPSSEGDQARPGKELTGQFPFTPLYQSNLIPQTQYGK